MKFNFLTSRRLKLRKVTQEVMDYVYEEMTDSELIEFFGLSGAEELAQEKEKYKGGYTIFNKKLLYFQLILKETEKVIGWCGYHTWYIDHDRAELGYGLNSDKYKRQGFMSEAIVPIIEYGFEEMNLHRMEAFISPTNIASTKLIKKMKFTQEGKLREHYKVDGKYEDSLVYSLLKGEWA